MKKHATHFDMVKKMKTTPLANALELSLTDIYYYSNSEDNSNSLLKFEKLQGEEIPEEKSPEPLNIPKWSLDSIS